MSLIPWLSKTDKFSWHWTNLIKNIFDNMVLIRLTGDLSIRTPNVNLDRPCRVQFASNTPVSEYQCLSM